MNSISGQRHYVRRAAAAERRTSVPLNRERPTVVQVVAWAASNGDRRENADYLYSKRRLRQIRDFEHYGMLKQRAFQFKRADSVIGRFENVVCASNKREIPSASHVATSPVL